MLTDYKIVGELRKEVVGAGSYDQATDGQGNKVGYMVIQAITSVVVTSFVSYQPKTGVTPVTGFTIGPGGQVLGAKSFTISSGTAQVFWVL